MLVDAEFERQYTRYCGLLFDLLINNNNSPLQNTACIGYARNDKVLSSKGPLPAAYQHLKPGAT